jgi:RNA polymerase sigma factor (sigma-70 family)
MPDDADKALRPVQGSVEAALIANHRDFLRFLVRRLGDADTAEDVLQRFYLRAIDKGSGLQKSESVIAWLYRVLRTTLVDHYRRETTRRRQEADYAQMEILSNEGRDAELESAICACFEALLPTLKAEYAEILQRVDLQGTPPGDAARDLGLTPNNLRVRLHRARQALKQSLLVSCGVCAVHGCLNCDCGHAERPGGLSGEAVPSVS